MKNVYIIIAALSVLIFAACKKDHGNYTYTDNEVISVTGLASNYTVVTGRDTLVVNINAVSQKDANAQFSYEWGLYDSLLSLVRMDTIAKTQNLKYPVTKPASLYKLVLKVTNKNNNYSQYFFSNVAITTPTGKGWYVAKDDGSNADLDLFLTSTSLIPDSKKDNLYSVANGATLPGKAKQLNFFSTYKSFVTGEISNTRSLVLLTDKDVAPVYINNTRKINNFSSIFYAAPAVNKPAIITANLNGYFLINNGQAHSIYNQASLTIPYNTGKFGDPKFVDANNTPYSLAPYVLGGTNSNAIFFNNTNSTFYLLATNNTTFATINDGAGGLSISNNNQQMLYMGYNTAAMVNVIQGTGTVTGYAIFQDKTTPATKIISKLTYQNTTTPTPAVLKLTATKTTILPTEKLYNATMWAVSDTTASPLMYFVNGNEVWSRNLTTNAETLQYTVPAGETVTFIRHRKYAAEGTGALAFNYIMVGTSSAGGYKVRMFPRNTSTGFFTGVTPAFILDGIGTARDVMYVTQFMDEKTYPGTY